MSERISPPERELREAETITACLNSTVNPCQFEGEQVTK